MNPCAGAVGATVEGSGARFLRACRMTREADCETMTGKVQTARKAGGKALGG